MKNKKFWIAFTIFTGFFLVLGLAFLILVQETVLEYDNAHPEHIVEEELSTIRAEAVSGKLLERIQFPKIGCAAYEDVDEVRYRNDYLASITSAKELTYQVATGEGGDLTKAYTLYADEKPFARMTLTGTNDRNKLFFFSMADWSVEKIIPITSVALYHYQVYLPEGISLTLNGKPFEGFELLKSSPIKLYDVGNFVNEPTFAFTDAFGKPISYESRDNVVKPICYQYALELPSTISVVAGGVKQEGTASENGLLTYRITSMQDPQVVLTDEYGHSVSYHGESSVPLYEYTIKVPETFRVLLNGNEMNPSLATKEENADQKEASNYTNVKLPGFLTWKLSLLGETISVDVVDNLGQMHTEKMGESHSLAILSLNGADELPSDLAAVVDPMKFATDWSKYTTDDLPGSLHGFYTIASYFRKDSNYYQSAYQYAIGDGITVISIHTLDSFTNQKVSNFVRYSDDFFSCEVYLKKNMTLYSVGGAYFGPKTDVFHSIIYYHYDDPTPNDGIANGKWVVALMRDVQ